MIVWLLAIGVVSILGQVILLRELNVAFYGSELIYILGFGVWLFWTGAGAAAGRRSHLPSSRRVRLLLVAFALILPLLVVEVRGLRLLFGGVAGAYLSFPRQLVAMTVSLLPVGVILGLLFQWAAKIYVVERRTLAAAYAIESVGGLAGGAMATLFLMWGIQNFTAALLCALMSLAAAGHPWRRDRPGWLLPAGTVTCVLLVSALLWSGHLDRRLTAWNHPLLVDTRDTPYGRVTVTKASGQVSVFENDALAFETEGTGAEEFAHMAALQHAGPDSVLVMGGGLEGIVEELLQHRPRKIDYVELDAALLDLVTDHLPDRTRSAMSAEPLRVVVSDPRRFLGRGGAYDLILVGMPEPDSGRTNRFYTREFFERCAGRLASEGVLAFRLRGAENLWTPQQTRRAASIHVALRSVFRDVVVLPGVTNIVLASNAPLARDPEILVGRLRDRKIEAMLVIPDYVRYLYTNDRFFEIADALNEADAPLNTDLRPICYQYTLLIWLSRFFPAMAVMEIPDLDPVDLARSPASWIAVVVLVGIMALGRIRPLVRRALLAAVAGLAGMVLETVLILHYQTGSGVLFQDLGLLLTLFMAGLALGAAAMDRRARRNGPEGLTRTAGVLAVGGLVGLSLVVALLLPAGAVAGLAATSLLLLACGFLVAAVFAYASLRREPDQRRVISPLYSADLLGGCFGSLAAGLFLIPVAGLSGSAWLIVLLGLAAVLLV